MEICMTAEEFAKNSLSKYNAVRQECKDEMIDRINWALGEFAGRCAKVTVKIECSESFRDICADTTEWLDVVDEIQEELVQKGFRSTLISDYDVRWASKLTVEVSNND